MAVLKKFYLWNKLNLLVLVLLKVCICRGELARNAVNDDVPCHFMSSAYGRKNKMNST